MSAATCDKCGTDKVFLAQRQKKDGSYGWALFNKTPNGPLKSFSISEKDKKKVAVFALNNDQKPGVDYYTMHYNTKTGGCNPDAGSGSVPAPRSASASPSGDSIPVHFRIGSKTYEGFVSEIAF